jgi:hypothetical protein
MIAISRSILTSVAAFKIPEMIGGSAKISGSIVFNARRCCWRADSAYNVSAIFLLAASLVALRWVYYAPPAAAARGRQRRAAVLIISGQFDALRTIGTPRAGPEQFLVSNLNDAKHNCGCSTLFY